MVVKEVRSSSNFKVVKNCDFGCLDSAYSLHRTELHLWRGDGLTILLSKCAVREKVICQLQFNGSSCGISALQFYTSGMFVMTAFLKTQ